MDDTPKNRERVFISYSRADQAFALQLAADLKARGVDAWIDQHDIPAGARWDNELQSALKVTTRLVAVLSPDSAASENVLDEINYALDDGDTIVPVLHRDCDVPMRLRRIQWVDMRGEYSSSLDDLVARLEHVSNPTASPPPGPLPVSRPAVALTHTTASVPAPAIATTANKARSMIAAAGFGAMSLVVGVSLIEDDAGDDDYEDTDSPEFEAPLLGDEEAPVDPEEAGPQDEHDATTGDAQFE